MGSSPPLSDDQRRQSLTSTERSLGRQRELKADLIARAVPENTQRAYEADWRSYAAWCDTLGIDPTVPSVDYLSTYLSAMAMGQTPTRRIYAVSTIERHLAAIVMRYRLSGHSIDSRDPQIALTMRGIRRSFLKAPAAKRPILTDDVKTMVGLIPQASLKGVQARAILLLGFAGGLRRSEIVGLDVEETAARIIDPDYKGWIELRPEGLLLTLRSKGDLLRTVAIGVSDTNFCPVAAVAKWIELGKIQSGPLFRSFAAHGTVSSERLPAKQVARLVKRYAIAAGLPDLVDGGDPARAYSAHSLRAGLATSADVPEPALQSHLGHASSAMTQRYVRHRDAFRINLTKRAGL